MKKSIFFLLWVLTLSASAQQISQSEATPIKPLKKKHFYLTWGYNRSWYNKSDIYFKGPGYDFTLYDVVARDRPSPLGFEYINPLWFTAPQFNFRFGYFLSDKYAISIGWDHMKYVVDVPQHVTIAGQIGNTISNPPISTDISSGNYSGTYHGDDFDIKPDFLVFEHTDGLNLVTVDMDRYDQVWKSKKQNNLGLSVVTGLGLGPVIPRSDVHFFGVGENHPWNLSGWGGLGKVGVNFNILASLFLRADFKTGYIRLSKIPTTGRHEDVAKQKIVFYETTLQLGVKF